MTKLASGVAVAAARTSSSVSLLRRRSTAAEPLCRGDRRGQGGHFLQQSRDEGLIRLDLGLGIGQQEPGGVVEALGSAALQVVTTGIEQAAAARLLPGQDGAGPQPAPQRLAIGIEMPGDRVERGACGMQAGCLLEPGLPVGMGGRDPLPSRVGWHDDYLTRRHQVRHLRPHRFAGPANRAVVALRAGMDGLAEVAEQVIAIRDLDGTGCTLARAIRTDAGPVAGDDRDARVDLQSRRLWPNSR
ncbi:MAG: hypothetical protein DI532_19550 [Azospirillum brasilense]|nr:MAG: hypothetical protein DI532_19550 [Azospirillum brasilense]